MDQAHPPPPLDVPAVCGDIDLHPSRPVVRLRPTTLTLWIDDGPDESLLVVDADEAPVLRLTPESARRFSRALADLLSRWSP